jgi:DNA-binding transcriptional LysR family regulator
VDRLTDIALFLKVLDLGSISAAARHLDLSIAVASKRLQRLEQELGVRLLHRTTRHVHATAEGVALADQGRQLVEVTGTLRVSTSPTFGRLYISPRIPEFLALHPGVKLSIHFSDEVVDLVSAGFDMAIRIGTLEDSRLIARRLASNQRVLCASPDYLRKHGRPATPADLQHHQCLVQIGAQGRPSTWRLKGSSGREVTARINSYLESNLGDSLRDAALAGLGIALHSTWHVCDDLRAGRLETVLPDYPVADTAIYAIMPQRRLVPARVRAFTDCLLRRNPALARSSQSCAHDCNNTAASAFQLTYTSSLQSIDHSEVWRSFCENTVINLPLPVLIWYVQRFPRYPS